jgi:4-amino-4-deoxy-L-arabinose transferase-like glycosyltransferase
MLIPARADGVPLAEVERTPSERWAAPEVWVLAGLVLIGAVLRFATLASQSYWFDEAQGAHEMSLSLGAMFHSMIVHETNPPLYFVLGWLWVKVFGNGEAGLRALSALAGAAVIPITYLCGRELVSRRAGLVAAALATVNPFMIWYSQEAREYMLLAALCGLSLLCFARALRVPSGRRLGWWALASALAVLTHSFAAFLVAPEALWLIYVARSRGSVLAAGAVAVVQAALLPFLLTHATTSLLGFIKTTPLSMRIQQVPTTFALGTLSRDALVSYGLVGAAALAVVLIVLLVGGGTRSELRGAGIAAGLAACVLLVPLVLALAGEDYYIPRALMPAWIPLAVVVGAACTVRRAQVPGAALALVMLGAFVYAQVRIDGNPLYQRPPWRAVAAALGGSRGDRAVIVYDSLGNDPLSFYLPRVSWSHKATVPVTIDEVDVVGSTWQRPPDTLSGGTRLIASKAVGDYLVARFSLASPWHLAPDAIGARAQSLLVPAPPAPSVLVQRGSS